MIYRVYSVAKNGQHNWLADFRFQLDALVFRNKQERVYQDHLDFLVEEVDNSAGS